MKNSRRSRCTTRRAFVTYIIVSLAPILLLGSIFLYSTYTSSRNSTLSSLQQRVELAGSSFDRLIDNIRTVTAHFSTEYTEGKLKTASDIQKQFTTYIDTFALSGRLFFYPRGEQIIYSAEGGYSYSVFDRVYAFAQELDMVSFYTRLNTLQSAAYFSSLSLDEQSNYFICMQTVPTLSATPEGVLFYILDASAIKQMAADYLGEFSGYFAIFDADKRTTYVLSSYSGHTPAEVRAALTVLKGGPSLLHTIGREPFITLRIPTDKYGFVYTLALAESVLLHPQRMHVQYLSIGLLALAALAVVLSLVMARYQTRPINRLAQSLDIMDEGDAALDHLDVLEAIDRQYHTIQNENERLVLQIHSYAEQARARLLEDLISGGIREQASLEDALKASGVSFDHPLFFVMIIRLGNTAHRADAEAAVQLFAEADFRYGKAYAFPTASYDKIGILVNTHSSDPEQSDDDLRTTAVKLFVARLEKLHFRPGACGVSRIRQNALRMSQQLFEAFAAMEGEGAGIHLFRQDSANEQNLFLQEAELFRQSLLYGNQAAALQTASRLLTRADKEHWALERTQALCFKLVNVLSGICMANGLPIDETEMALAASHAQPMTLLELLQEPVTALCTLLAEQKAATLKEVNQRVISHIYSHFSDSNLSVESVAESFRMSESNIRRIVREATGSTFSNYLTTLRFAYIKKRLSETDEPIRVIVESAGYIDVSSFTRKFKAAEGVTPGQYRTATQAHRYASR